MSGDELDHAAVLWLRGWGTDKIAKELRVREATIYRNIEGIKFRAREIREGGYLEKGGKENRE